MEDDAVGAVAICGGADTDGCDCCLACKDADGETAEKLRQN